MKEEPVVVDSNTKGAPGKPSLSDNNGHDTGLQDGSYTITMNMWWGTNAAEYRLYENGQLIDVKPLTQAPASSQQAVTWVTDRAVDSDMLPLR